MLHNRRIVVTGASSGIGRGLAISYARHGATVWGVARSEDELASLAADHGVRPVAADLTTDAGVRAVATAVDHHDGALDVVVHAAGLLGPVGVSLADYPEGEWDRVFSINVTSVQRLHANLAPLLDRGQAPAVVALSSTVGREGRAGWGMYAVSKHALEGWVAVLTHEWDGRVYSVNPGGTRTPMRAAAVPDEDPTTIPTPEDIAPLFLRLAHPDAPEESGALLAARDWIGRDPWSGLGQGRAADA